MANRLNLTNRNFGRLTALYDSGKRVCGKVLWFCTCSCGGKAEVQTTRLQNKHTLSCGCLHKEAATKQCRSMVEDNTRHGHCIGDTSTPTYSSWHAMMQRCTNPKHTHYSKYGGSINPVLVCSKWLTFEGFLADMGERPEKCTLGRLEDVGNYEKTNCRWMTKAEHGIEKRKKNIQGDLMRKALLTAVVMFACSLGAIAWDCPTGQIRQQAPAGTSTSTPYYDVVEGIAFICVPTPTTPVTTPPSSTSTSSSTSGANSNSTSGASSTATGGKATATGGKATSTSGVSNSGNSNNTNKLSNTLSNTIANTNKLSNSQKQGQTQSNASTNSNQSSATGNGDNSDNSVTNVEAPKIPVNTAMAPPVFSTANCFKGFSGGAQSAVAGLSFGGGKIDPNCAALSTAQNLYAMGSRLAACKVIVTTKSAKSAGVTMEDCMAIAAPRVVVQAAPVAPVLPPVVVTVQSPPQIVYIPQPHTTITVTAPKTVAKRKPVVKHVCPVTPLQQACPVAPREK